MLDPLSDALNSVRLGGGLFLDANFTAPWCVASYFAPDLCRQFLPDLDHVIGYHVVTHGSLLINVEGEAEIPVYAGEIVLLPRNDPHILASAPGMKPIATADLIERSPEHNLLRIRHGGNGAETMLVCGFLGTRGKHHPLLMTLPPLVKIDVRAAASRDWIETSVRFAAESLLTGAPAAAGVIARLSEILLVEAVREYASKLDDRHQGWMKGLNDPQIARALTLIHRNIAAPLTADELANEAALSRSAFMERFSAVIGIPPIRYLTLQRLESAKRQLSETRLSVDRIAHAVGYESPEGFRRAFQREYGAPPAQWRRQQSRTA